METNQKSVAATLGWSRDSRDNVLAPTRGRYQRLFGEVSLPVLDLKYYRATYQFQQFVPVTKSITFAFNTEIGYGDGYAGKPYPFFKNFYGGGGSVLSEALNPHLSDLEILTVMLPVVIESSTSRSNS